MRIMGVFEIVFAAIALFIIIASTLENQKKIFTSFIVFFICLAIAAGVLFTSLGNTVVTALSGFGATVYAMIPAFLQVPALLCFVVIMIAVLILYVIIDLFVTLFGGKERRRYKQYSSYVTTHRPGLGLLVGIFKAIVTVFILMVIVRLTLPLTGIDLSSSLLFTNANIVLDPVVAKFTELGNILFAVPSI